MRELAPEIGLPELAEMDEREFVNDFIFAAVIGLSDGDIVATHPPYEDAERIRRYGETMFHEGVVAPALRDAAVSAANRPGALFSFQELVAEFASRPKNPFEESRTSLSIRLHPEALVIDDHPIMFSSLPCVVIDYTASLSSRSVIADQLDFVEKGQMPFAYVPITTMHFTDRMLMHEYDRVHGPGIANQMIAARRYISRNDGIASATKEMIAVQSAAGVTTEIADVIICNGGQHRTREDLVSGARSASRLLKETGLFVIRAFAKPAGDEIGTDEVMAHALESGFKEQPVLETRLKSFSPGYAQQYGHDEEREIKTVVLTRQT